MDIQFSPGNFFIGNSPGIGSIRSSRITDLAEITPERHIMPFQILVHHRHHTDREITGDTATYLEETNAFATRIVAIPICKPDHVFNTTLHRHSCSRCCPAAPPSTRGAAARRWLGCRSGASHARPPRCAAGCGCLATHAPGAG